MPILKRIKIRANQKKNIEFEREVAGTQKPSKNKRSAEENLKLNFITTSLLHLQVCLMFGKTQKLTNF